MHIAILVPTRDRASLAAAAVASALTEADDSTTIFVSDNSTRASERDELRRLISPMDPRVRALVPSEPMAMTDHWEWALDQVLADLRVTHVCVVTDRTVFLPGGQSILRSLIERFPDQLITYSHDRVIDNVSPVLLEQVEWSGRLLKVASRQLLVMASQSEWHHALPRLMNCAVPRAAFEEVRQRFGSICASNAPDHSFASRLLATRDSILFLDRPLAIHYALDRSNGANYARGTESPDSVDFARHLATPMNSLTPAPEIRTIINPIVHEYCFVSTEPGGRDLPALDEAAYFDAMAAWSADIDDPGTRAEMERRLRARGWRPSRLRVLRRSVRRMLRTATIHRWRWVLRVVERVAMRSAPVWPLRVVGLPRVLERRGLLPPGSSERRTFPATSAALAHAFADPRPPNRFGTNALNLADRDAIARPALTMRARQRPSAIVPGNPA